MEERAVYTQSELISRRYAASTQAGHLSALRTHEGMKYDLSYKGVLARIP